MSESSWVRRLKEKWQLKSTFQVAIILIVFACTGFSVLFLKRPLLEFLAGPRGNETLGTVLYYVFILPVYNVLLLGYGFLFGQFHFFWHFEKRFFNRIIILFKKPK